MMEINRISASAGSGKTHRLTGALAELLTAGAVSPEKVIAVTFTVKAAGELKERVRQKLLLEGRIADAHRVEAALIGTVHSVCERILRRFAFEAGISPGIGVIPEDESGSTFRESLAASMTKERLDRILPVLERFDRSEEEFMNDVREVANMARVNAVHSGDLAGMARRSVEGFVRLLPPPAWKTHEDAEAELMVLLEQVIAAIERKVESGEDPTDKTKKYLAALKRTGQRLKANPSRVAWSERAKIFSGEPAVSSASAVALLSGYASRQLADPLLRSDAESYITILFDIAADALKRYDAWKKQRGLIDFIDMEEKTLALLRNRETRESLQEDYALLLVDEFQDTSPIQLAIFVRLGEITGRAVWVGDRKQSIYGFRDTDPELMDNAYSAAGPHGKDETLQTSYRSRKGIVDFCNAVFTKTFGQLGYEKKAIELIPHRADPSGLSPAIELWAIASKNKKSDTRAIAQGVRAMLSSDPPFQIVDRVSEEVRPVRPGDIAVLRRTNEDCAFTAGELARLGIQASVAQKGLDSTLEGIFLLSAIETVIDPYASLPALILLHLSTGGSPLTLVNDRIRELAGKTPAAPPWDEEPLLKRLRALRNEMEYLSPAEMLDRIIEESGVRPLCERYGKGMTGAANVEKIRFYAREYEEICRFHHAGPSLLGLLLFLKNLQKGGDQAAAPSENAVTVSTYHRAKGMEWPVVILGDLRREPGRPCCCLGAHIRTDATSFDLMYPLKGRWIRFWPWPYGSMSSGAPLYEVVLASPEEADAAAKERREEQRLLYVGFTRARDTLVLPARLSTPIPSWIEALDASLELPVQDPAGDGVRAFGGGLTAMSRVRIFDPKQAPSSLTPARPGRAFAYPEGPAPARDDLFITASRLKGPVEATVMETATLGNRIAISSDGGDSERALGNALHAFIAADRAELGDSERLEMAARHISIEGVKGIVQPENFIEISNRLQGYLKKKWPSATVWKELPLYQRVGTQILSGISDMVVQADGELHVIDHKVFPGTPEKCREHALSCAPQLFAYASALSAATGMPCRSTAIHFPFSGLMISIGKPKE